MISFDSFAADSASPIYMQIINHIKRGIAAGTVCDGDELPSRRVLSTLLGVNPNTVQKAYALLEEEGLMHSRAGAKSCICLSAGAAERTRRELLEQSARAAVRQLRQMGVTQAEAASLLERFWETEA